MTYQEQIKHPKWQKKRLEVLKANKFRCQECHVNDEELHVHHPFYSRGAMIWEYKKEELQCLCHRCHKDAHAIDEKIKKALALCNQKNLVLDFILALDKPAPSHEAKPSNYQSGNPIRRVAVARQPRNDDFVLAEVTVSFHLYEVGHYIHIPKDLLAEYSEYVRVIVSDEDNNLAAEDERLYRDYPHLKPHDDDTGEERADKFFAKMRLLMG